MTRSFEIPDSELPFEAGKALEEAIEGSESDTSVGANASEVELTVRPGPIPAGPICRLTPNPTSRVEKPFLPAADTSMEAVRRYILYALMHDYGYSEDAAQSVANSWRHGRGAVFRDITLDNLKHIFQEADGRCLHKVMTLDTEEEQRRQEQRAIDTWNQNSDRPIAYIFCFAVGCIIAIVVLVFTEKPHFALPVVVATQTLLHHLLPPVPRWKKQSAIVIGCLVAATLVFALAG